MARRRAGRTHRHSICIDSICSSQLHVGCIIGGSVCIGHMHIGSVWPVRINSAPVDSICVDSICSSQLHVGCVIGGSVCGDAAARAAEQCWKAVAIVIFLRMRR